MAGLEVEGPVSQSSVEHNEQICHLMYSEPGPGERWVPYLALSLSVGPTSICLLGLLVLHNIPWKLQEL